MRRVMVIAAIGLISLGAGALIFRQVDRVGRRDLKAVLPPGISTRPRPSVIRLALAPERDIFEQRRQYRCLADYLEGGLDRPIELVTVNTYAATLDEFAAGEVDAAFLGSMVAKLAVDQQQAVVVLKTQNPGGIMTYHGVIVVPEDSAIKSIADLAGKSVGCVKTTTAGEVFARYTLRNAGLLEGPAAAKLRSVGTHDDVILEVLSGKLDAGSVKNTRLDAWETKTGRRMRRLASSAEVPNNALVLRSAAAAELGPKLGPLLLHMHETAEGRAVLAQFGAERFVPCQRSEYDVIDQMQAPNDGKER